jgi:hypothetical protein
MLSLHCFQFCFRIHRWEAPRKQGGTEYETHQLLVYTDDVIILGENTDINTIKKKKETFIET